MNALKSLYVTLYMVATMSIAVLAVQMLLATQDYLTWGGVLLVYAPFVLVISSLMIFRNVPRTSARFPVLIVMGLIGVIASLRGYSLGGSATALVRGRKVIARVRVDRHPGKYSHVGVADRQALRLDFLSRQLVPAVHGTDPGDRR